MTAIASNYLTPGPRDEDWRFTPLNRLAGLHDGSAVTGTPMVRNVSENSGVLVSTIPNQSVPSRIIPTDAVALRTIENATDILKIEISKETSVAEPIFIDRTGSSNVGANYERIIISVGAFSKATVIIQNSGSANLAEDIEMELGNSSDLTFISLQEWSNDSVHLGRHQAIVGPDAHLTSIEVSLGGSLVRLLPRVDFEGSGGSVDLYGLYFAGSEQHLEHRVHVEHSTPNCRSRVSYKGALLGENARTVWFGDVAIRAKAEGTDTYEVNRNLLLSDGARADSVPNLEIETGEIVGAGHASTTGRFDDEQLFYLMARGIDETEARRLVIRGFFAELLRNIKNEVIETRLIDHIDRELGKVSS